MAAFLRLPWGFAALPDSSRSGVPQKLNAEQIEQVMKWADAEALTVPDLLARLKDHFRRVVHRSTLTTALKKAGYVWKRTQHSLKKRDEQRFQESKIEIK